MKTKIFLVLLGLSYFMFLTTYSNPNSTSLPLRNNGSQSITEKAQKDKNLSNESVDIMIAGNQNKQDSNDETFLTLKANHANKITSNSEEIKKEIQRILLKKYNSSDEKVNI